MAQRSERKKRLSPTVRGILIALALLVALLLVAILFNLSAGLESHDGALGEPARHLVYARGPFNALLDQVQLWI